MELYKRTVLFITKFDFEDIITSSGDPGDGHTPEDEIITDPGEFPDGMALGSTWF